MVDVGEVSSTLQVTSHIVLCYSDNVTLHTAPPEQGMRNDDTGSEEVVVPLMSELKSEL